MALEVILVFREVASGGPGRDAGGPEGQTTSALGALGALSGQGKIVWQLWGCAGERRA